MRVSEAVATANENAAAALQFKQQMLADENALRIKTENDVKLASDLTKLQDEVSNAKSTTCFPSAIIAMVDGLRHLQTGSNTGAKNPNPAAHNSGAASHVAATTAGSADQLIAHWIGNLYQHDSICAENINQISQLQAGATP